jgi:hypothetical protein
LSPNATDFFNSLLSPYVLWRPTAVCIRSGTIETPRHSGERYLDPGGNMQKTLYVGLDVHKATLSVTVAEEGRDGRVRFIGTIPNTPTDVAKIARRLGKE